MDYFNLLIGICCAGIGGELFVRGSVGLAHWLRISPGIIGATVAAFATSSPEISVSITSALAKKTTNRPRGRAWKQCCQRGTHIRARAAHEANQGSER